MSTRFEGESQNSVTNIQQVLRGAKARFAPISDSASLDAQVLLAEVLHVERSYLLAHPEMELTPQQADQFNDYVMRRAAGEPIAYIIGKRAWYDREFFVSPAVLIPRPETELLLEQALAYAQEEEVMGAVDVGTGSGALAVTFAAHHPEISVTAVDISPDALAIAQRNAQAHAVNIRLLQGELLQPVIDARLQANLIMANLPYIPTHDLRHLDVAKHEPLLALDGGADGLKLVRRLLWQVRTVCPNKGLLLLEIGAGQGKQAAALAQSVAPKQVDVLRDYAGHDRIVRIEL